MNLNKYAYYEVTFIWKGDVDRVEMMARHQRHLMQRIEEYIERTYPENKGWHITPDYLTGVGVWRVVVFDEYQKD